MAQSVVIGLLLTAREFWLWRLPQCLMHSDTNSNDAVDIFFPSIPAQGLIFGKCICSRIAENSVLSTCQQHEPNSFRPQLLLHGAKQVLFDCWRLISAVYTRI